jgi:hypothetical protein
VIVPPPKQPEQPSLSGATDLADVRMMLKEWFQSTDIPEEEDREAVCRYVRLQSSLKIKQKVLGLVFPFQRRPITAIFFTTTATQFPNI